MIPFSGRGIVLDIEGTVSPISYVHEVLFGFARRELRRFLENALGRAEFYGVFDLIAQDAGWADLAGWRAASHGSEMVEVVERAVLEWMAADRKCRGLKELQGQIWKAGYESGELRSQVFDDVPPALRNWRQVGIDICIYSSGSVAAQKLFFAHTNHGNLLGLLSGFHDTTVGAKQSPESYRAIAAEMSLSPAELLFVSDVDAELRAAEQTGFQTALAVRPGNRPAEGAFERITDFSQILTVSK